MSVRGTDCRHPKAGMGTSAYLHSVNQDQPVYNLGKFINSETDEQVPSTDDPGPDLWSPHHVRKR